jgi:hypothetical protein
LEKFPSRNWLENCCDNHFLICVVFWFEILLLILIFVFDEQYRQDIFDGNRSTSIRNTDFLSAVIILSLALMFGSKLKSAKFRDSNRLNIFRLMSDGHKKSSWARLFAFAFLTRRILFCAIVFWPKEIDFFYKLHAFSWYILLTSLNLWPFTRSNQSFKILLK